MESKFSSQYRYISIVFEGREEYSHKSLSVWQNDSDNKAILLELLIQLKWVCVLEYYHHPSEERQWLNTWIGELKSGVSSNQL